MLKSHPNTYRWKRSALVCVVVLFMSIAASLVQAYTLYTLGFNGASATFRLDSSIISRGNWASVARSAAQDWNNTGTFTFTENGSSANVISTYFDSSANALLAYTAPYRAGDGLNRYVLYFITYVNIAKPFYDGFQSPPADAYDLRTILRHELGHALGLGHSSPGTMMQGNGFNRGQVVQIGTDDRNGASYLYNPNYNGHSPQTGGPDGTLRIGSVDDTNYKVGYKGAGWTTFSGKDWPRASGSTVSFSNGAGSTYWLDFTGSRVTRRFTLANNRGNYSIYIDGNLVEQRSATTTITRWQAAKTYQVPFGQHLIEVRNAGFGYIDSDEFLVDAAFPFPGAYQDNDSSKIQYIGHLDQNGRLDSWGSASFPNASGGTLHFSNQAEDAAGTSWVGTSVTYIFTRASNRGKAMITIDGQNVCPAPQPCGYDGYLDLYSAGTSWQNIVTFNLPYGYHTIYVGVTGLKNSYSTDTYVDLDAFVTQ